MTVQVKRIRRANGSWSKNYYLFFRDHNGIQRKPAAFTDKRLSEDFARHLETLIEYRKAGRPLPVLLLDWIETIPLGLRKKLASYQLLQEEHLATAKPLSLHIGDWKISLEAKGNVEQYIGTCVSRLLELFSACRCVFWADITANRIEKALCELTCPITGSNASAETRNQYLRHIKQFCRWMVQEKRAPSSPVEHLEGLNVKAHGKKQRRVLDADEIKLLLEGVRQMPSHHRLTGHERFLLYWLTLVTGARWGDLVPLHVSSFHMSGKTPYVVFKATDQKSKKDTNQPLPVSIVGPLNQYFASKKATDRAFPTWKGKSAAMFKGDLTTLGFELVTHEGELVFHSLRHTFITNLALAGVHPAIAQRLARHSDIRLTLEYYTHLTLEQQANELKKIPEMHELPEIIMEPDAQESETKESVSLRRSQNGSTLVQISPSESQSVSLLTQLNNKEKSAELIEIQGGSALEVVGAGDGIRTHGPQLRKLML